MENYQKNKSIEKYIKNQLFFQILKRNYHITYYYIEFVKS